jgi:hypothetical protein
MHHSMRLSPRLRATCSVACLLSAAVLLLLSLLAATSLPLVHALSSVSFDSSDLPAASWYFDLTYAIQIHVSSSSIPETLAVRPVRRNGSTVRAKRALTQQTGRIRDGRPSMLTYCVSLRALCSSAQGV